MADEEPQNEMPKEEEQPAISAREDGREAPDSAGEDADSAREDGHAAGAEARSAGENFDPAGDGSHAGDGAHAAEADGNRARPPAAGVMMPDHSPDMALTVEAGAEEQQAPALPYPVVGFGASAGGLQAFKEILENLNPETGMSFVLVTHLAPDQRSFLSEIVERYTQMPVLSAEDGQRPLANHLYVLQPNQALTVREGMFRVEQRGARDRIPRTIDRFFHSLAADQKNHAIGVVLSGADADGALGLKAIKGGRGIAIVQSPDTAVHPAILNELGLPAALKAMVKEFGEREGMLATYISQDLPESWAEQSATAIYRIAQEVLRNVAKHAGKTHVKVILSGKDEHLQLKVMDFGMGFDQEAERPGEGLGMINMQERARLAGGSFNVQSALGQGTTVIVEVPLGANG